MAAANSQDFYGAPYGFFGTWPPAAAGSETTISVGVGAVAVTGVNASINAETQISASVGAVAIAGINPTLLVPTPISVGVGAVVVAGVNANISTGAGTIITTTVRGLTLLSVNTTIQRRGWNVGWTEAAADTVSWGSATGTSKTWAEEASTTTTWN